jgi:hypothetical protein
MNRMIDVCTFCGSLFELNREIERENTNKKDISQKKKKKKKKRVITFFPMNYQKMRNAPMNYQLDQNRAFNYQRQQFSPIPSVKGVKTNGQRVMCCFIWGHVGR